MTIGKAETLVDLVKSKQELDELFIQCPRFIKHDITEEQVLYIARKAVFLAKEDSERELGRLTKKGIIYLIGAILTGLSSWAIQSGFFTKG